MYNSEVKQRFIQAQQYKPSSRKNVVQVFNSIEKYEQEWGADLCTRSAEELQPVIDQIAGLHRRSADNTLSMLRCYFKWCKSMDIPGARVDELKKVKIAGLDKMKAQMVSGPVHLQQYLDAVYDAVDEETVDIVYRCYFWMAFGGINEKDTILIRNDQVDFDRMVIKYHSGDVPIYREAVLAFKKAATLTDFRHNHGTYENRWNRVPGDTLMRGVKTSGKALNIRSAVNRNNRKAKKEEDTEQRLSFTRVRRSGLFYRIYEMERTGLPMDFADAALRVLGEKNYAKREDETRQEMERRIKRELESDYDRWIMAFYA